MNFLQKSAGFLDGWRRVERGGSGGLVGHHAIVRGWRVSVFSHRNNGYTLQVEERSIDDFFVFASKEDARKRLSYLLKEEQGYDEVMAEVEVARKSSSLSNYEKRTDLTYLMYRLVKGDASDRKKGLLAVICDMKDELDDSPAEEDAMIDGRTFIRKIDEAGIRERLVRR